MKTNGIRGLSLLTCVLLILLVHGGLPAQAGPEPAGWYAGDMHVHRSCGSAPVSLQTIYNGMSEQNLAVLSLLADMGNGEVQNATTDLPLVNGQDASISTPGRIVHWDAEWHWDATYTDYAHQALGGHIVVLGLTSAQQIWQEYTYPIIQWAHQQGALAGFAHLQYLGSGFPQTLNCCLPIEYPVEVGLGNCDFLDEDVEGGDAAMTAYYRLLNCGFRPGFAGGSDYPCGQTTFGAVLTYVKVPGALTYRAWIDGIAAGKTVVSLMGHDEFIALTVSGTAGPGDEIKLTGPGTVQVSAVLTAAGTFYGTGSLDIVCNGAVVASQNAVVTASTPVTVNTSIGFTKSGWIAARRIGPSGHEVQTGAVFVTVNGGPIRASVDDANFYVSWMDNLLANTAPGAVWSSFFPTQATAVRARYQAARAVYAQIAADAGGAQPFGITTTSLPNGAVNAAYTAALAAGGGVSPYTWSIASGAFPTGLTLNPSTGAISGTPTASGTFGFTVQATDSSSPAKTATEPLTIAVTTTPTTAGIWPVTAIPSNPDGGPDSAVEIGVKFRSDVAGSISGIRFYKAATNTGTHIGNLWSSSGTKLATATFAGETASGWQQVSFPTPVSIAAGTVYIASYHCTVGHYSADLGYFGSVGYDNAPLHALADGASGANGVYAYGATSAFPTQGWNSSNYWVDVIFQTGAGPKLNTISVTPSNPFVSSGATQQFTATGGYSDGSTQNVTSSAAWTSSAPSVASVSASGLATALASGTTLISASLSGVGASTQLTVQAGQPTTVTLWSSAAVPETVDSGPDSAVELGVRFQSDVAGRVTAIRFYKAATNTGTHTAHLWSNTGTLLASGTFSGESASGWQQMTLATPVSIVANTPYVASYHCSAGHYSDDVDYFAALGVSTPPLHAPADGVTGYNGVYSYGASSAFPNQGWNSSNYWVDVVFQTTQ